MEATTNSRAQTEKHEILILVVEDDAEWNQALVEMYKKIFRPFGRTTVRAATNAKGALLELRKQRFHLLSCDINLAAGGNTRDADGRSVLRYAAEQRKAVAAVVPTGAATDAELFLAIPDQTELHRMRLTKYLDDLFDHRVLRLDKSAGLSPAKTTSAWARVYGDEIVRMSHAWPVFPPPYTIRVSWPDDAIREALRRTGQSDDAIRVEIWTKDKSEKKYMLPHASAECPDVPPDREFFLRLIRATAAGDSLCAADLVALYGGDPNDPRQPEILMGTISRRLTKAGLDPDRLVAGSPTKGWKLCADNTFEIITETRERAERDAVFESDRQQLQDTMGIYLKRRGVGPDK